MDKRKVKQRNKLFKEILVILVILIIGLVVYDNLANISILNGEFQDPVYKGDSASFLLIVKNSGIMSSDIEIQVKSELENIYSMKTRVEGLETKEIPIKFSTESLSLGDNPLKVSILYSNNPSGFKKIEEEFLIQVLATDILAFDVSHNNRNGLGYSEFFKNFRDVNFQVRLIEDSINEASLKDINLLVLTIHESDYLQSELDEINKFLEDGGNLIVFGDFINKYDINRVISSLGITIKSCSASWDVFPSSNHTLTENVQRLQFPGTDCLDIKNVDFKVIIKGDRGPVLAVKENGNKILISGDSNFCDDEYIKFAHNKILCKNIASWLSKE